MKKIIITFALILASVLTYACTGGTQQKGQTEGKEAPAEGSVIVMNKDMFIKNVFDYEKSKETNPPSSTFMPTGAVPAA